MDGDIKPMVAHGPATDVVARDTIDARRPAGRRPKTVRWVFIVGLLLVLVLGGLYWFNQFREKAIASYFAANKPPPPQISAVVAETATVPRNAPAIGSLAAVHQVTITPEVGGRIEKISFTSGTTVKAGDPLVQLNDAPDRADLANYESQARWWRSEAARKASLAQRQYASQESVEQNQTQFEQAQAQMAKTQAIIAQKLIRAPFAGRLGVRQVDLGQFVNPGAAIVTLTDLTQLYVNFTLPSQQRDQISVGQQVNVQTDAFPGRVFTAKITAIEPQIRSDTRTMAMQATMTNLDEILLPGMFVDVAVVLPAEPDRVVLPETAVDYTLYGDSVYVIREDGADAAGKPVLKAFRTAVKTGPRWNNKVAILSGVKAGDRVVAAGQVKVQNGQPVIVTGNPPPQPPADPTQH
jgi:multidrug efflux system membrane fusion protein